MSIRTEKDNDIENVVDAYCLSCTENTLDNEAICESCHVRKMMDRYREDSI